ncbi:hypothetical protein OAN82_01790 [Pelagibacteraceae bacterium]|nr:hypothetical protein [Pelagibacteraceae bacterium]MDC1158729.1 hypothetical protein [Pelagibacteraceae bacterium]
MKNILKYLAASLMIVSLSSAKAEIQYGFGLITGQTEVAGSETEGGETNSKTIKELFLGGDIFVESVSDSGFTYGVSYVPLDIELGSGERADVNTAADVASEADTGTRTASADVSDLITVYTNIPMGSNGWYGLLGAHMTTITTSETLVNSSYGNEDIFGAQIGLGKRTDKVKLELSYSDFEDISLSGSGGDNTSSISADADVLSLRLSYGF